MSDDSASQTREFEGVGASPGVTTGPALHIDVEEVEAPDTAGTRYTASQEDLDSITGGEMLIFEQLLPQMLPEVEQAAGTGLST